MRVGLIETHGISALAQTTITATLGCFSAHDDSDTTSPVVPTLICTWVAGLPLSAPTPSRPVCQGRDSGQADTRVSVWRNNKIFPFLCCGRRELRRTSAVQYRVFGSYVQYARLSWSSGFLRRHDWAFDRKRGCIVQSQVGEERYRC